MVSITTKRTAMKGYNAILIYDTSGEKILFCHRQKDPYKGKYNFVGGKIEQGEEGFAAAYRELFEETGISSADVSEKYRLNQQILGKKFTRRLFQLLFLDYIFSIYSVLIEIAVNAILLSNKYKKIFMKAEELMEITQNE